MRIAIVGLGEAGRCYAEAIAQLPGTRLDLCEAAPRDPSVDLADRLALTIWRTPGDWMTDCDWVFSFVPGEASLLVARGCLEHMTRSGGLFADFTTASPSVIREAARMAQGRGVLFLDVAIMGAIALNGAQAPLLVAGAATEEWRMLMGRLGASLTVMDDAEAGDASSLKLLRSAFTKSMEALTVEVLAAAERQGMRKRFYDVIADIDKASLPRYLETLVQTHLLHAARRGKEVAEVRRQFAAAKLQSDLLPSVEAAFERTVRALECDPPGEAAKNIEDAVRWLIRARFGDQP